MTTATFFAIMLALFLGAAIMVAMYYRYRARQHPAHKSLTANPN